MYYSPIFQILLVRASKFDLAVINTTYASSLVLSIFNCFFLVSFATNLCAGWPGTGWEGRQG